MSEMTEEEFWAALAPVTPPVVQHRLYYDAQGNPLFYTMQDEPGNYVEIDEETFHASPINVKVVDGKLKIRKTVAVSKLAPGEYGTACATHDVCVIVDESQVHTKWSLKQHDPD